MMYHAKTHKNKEGNLRNLNKKQKEPLVKHANKS